MKITIHNDQFMYPIRNPCLDGKNDTIPNCCTSMYDCIQEENYRCYSASCTDHKCYFFLKDGRCNEDSDCPNWILCDKISCSCVLPIV